MAAAHRRLAAISVVLFVVIGSCGGSVTTPTSSVATGPPPERALIVDLDMDSSDVMALGYAMNLPGYRVVGVTVPATGVGRCPQAADNARAIVAAMGRPDVPVACGSGAAGPANPFPNAWRDPSDALYGLSLKPVAADAPDAVELLVRLISEAAEPVDILAAGPLTNLAQLLEREPSLAARVHRLVAMAGAVSVPGNVDPIPATGSAEWNVWADPGAASAVLRSGIPVTLVPLDATNDVPVDPAFLDALATDTAAAAANITYELLARNAFLLVGGQYFWDQLAAAVLEDPTVVTLQPMRMSIGTQPGQLGRSLVDADGAEVLLATGGDPDRFRDVFLAGLRRGPERAPSFAPLGPVAVTYDGAACRVGARPDAGAGTYRLTFANQTNGSVALALVTLHPGAAWAQAEDYVASLDQQTEPPTFADSITVTPPAPGLESIVEIPDGHLGFACAELVNGAAVRIVLSEELVVR